MAEQTTHKKDGSETRLRRSQRLLDGQARPPEKVEVQASASATKSPVQTDDKNDSIDDDSAERLDPTRYGDWERNGRCIDF